MQINVKVGAFRTETVDAIVLGVFEGEPFVSVAASRRYSDQRRYYRTD